MYNINEIAQSFMVIRWKSTFYELQSAFLKNLQGKVIKGEGNKEVEQANKNVI